MTYRVIALDLDGTLLDRQKKILPESLTALALARQQGIKIVIVTGRHHSAIHPFYQALQLDTPAICCNGTYVYDYRSGQASHANPLTADQAKRVLSLLQEFDIHGLMYADDAMYYQNPTGHVIRTQAWASTLPELQRPLFKQVEDLVLQTDDALSIWKFATSHADIPTLNNFSRVVEQQLGLACEWSWQDQVDIAQTGNSKGKLLQQWVEEQGISMKEVVAFGDNFNDLSMLEGAGLGVAMGNSADEIKARADLVIGHHEQPGIAEVIRTRVLS
ncbi:MULTISPECIES: pyridoxal phosphatase [unclassified Brenneria]|uniref:pyridoxal phosphatase n=1 Tax=unclassified Brenneria TaxID=2634434 RepID=UPI0018F0A65F|nr:pyridoxal phosphatase [Brenneria sp. L3-3C-1]MBJ7221624.1 pyridoxal phosphatase [Brenneria sp. L3-3C-1]MEE3642866.1 pyridoxal phosphatase [Brenneria sp. L3_3C_1]